MGIAYSKLSGNGDAVHTQMMDFWTRNVFTVSRGTGSGFIWDDAGYAVTNYHVIENAREATVRLADGRYYRAALVGGEPAADGSMTVVLHDLEPAALRPTSAQVAGVRGQMG